MPSWQHRLFALAASRAPTLPASTDPGEVARCRRNLDLAGQAMPRPRGVAARRATGAPRPATWLEPRHAEPGRAVVYLHGGGYVVGSRRSHGHLAARLARACRARTLLFDYRLAPEHPCPAAVEDAVATWVWTLQRGHDPARTVLAGDSAGGGLAVSTLVALRDRGVPLPAAAVLLSPWTDLALTGASIAERAPEDPIVSPARLAACTALALGGRDPRDPVASPLYADLSGLPPLLVHVGGEEALLDDAVRLARRVREAGGAVDLAVEPGLMHVWHFAAPLVPEATAALAAMGAWVDRRA